MTTRSISASPDLYARIAGGSYVITIVAGTIALLSSTGRMAANLVAALSYVAVTVLFYFIFEPVSRRLSLLAASLSLMGCVYGVLTALGKAPIPLSPLVFFGFYCLLIGYLVWKSMFLPRFLGALMAFGGIGWLTFLSPSFSSALAPYNMFPGILGETALTLWLLFRGVDVAAWRAQAG